MWVCVCVCVNVSFTRSRSLSFSFENHRYEYTKWPESLSSRKMVEEWNESSVAHSSLAWLMAHLDSSCRCLSQVKPHPSSPFLPLRCSSCPFVKPTAEAAAASGMVLAMEREKERERERERERVQSEEKSEKGGEEAKHSGRERKRSE